MHPMNRLHRAGWPREDTRHAHELAQTDVDFCLAMGRILFPKLQGVIPRELTRVWCRAKAVLASKS